MGKLFLVPTPVGNLEDITFRAVRILKEADLVLCEDTRTSGKLLHHYDIKTPMQSHHMHNEHRAVEGLVRKLKEGASLALISDAGTPGISDPGYLLTRECIANGIGVECLPGATAFTPALVVSGLPSDRFVFEGFLPLKKGRKTRLEQLSEESRTMIFYESPHKLLKTLDQFLSVFGADRPMAVCRELTKLYEETRRGSISEVLGYYSNHPAKGEIVIVVAGKK